MGKSGKYRPLVAGFRLGVLAVLAFGVAWPVAAECRQALAIGLDVSGSVDRRDYALQIGGLAWALEDEGVRAALLAAPQAPVMLAVFDWSGPGDQRLILPWTEITGPAVLDGVVVRLRATPRSDGSSMTGVGAALIYGGQLLATRHACRRLTLDLSGDGISNTGQRPREVAIGVIGHPVTVNALVIGRPGSPGSLSPDPGLAELSAWFAAEVVRGPGAFVEHALGFEDFASAMRRKLIRELSGLVAVRTLPAGADRG